MNLYYLRINETDYSRASISCLFIRITIGNIFILIFGVSFIWDGENREKFTDKLFDAEHFESLLYMLPKRVHFLTSLIINPTVFVPYS
jgi:hypothetical protein